MRRLLALGVLASWAMAAMAVQPAQAAKPELEPAWYDRAEVFINFIEVAEKTPHQAHSVMYVVGPDQDEDGDAQQETHPDILAAPHDHVLDSVPGDPNYQAIRHIYLVLDSANPGTLAGPGLISEDDVLTAVEEGTVTIVDIGVHFLTAVVNEHRSEARATAWGRR